MPCRRACRPQGQTNRDQRRPQREELNLFLDDVHRFHDATLTTKQSRRYGSRGERCTLFSANVYMAKTSKRESGGNEIASVSVDAQKVFAISTGRFDQQPAELGKFTAGFFEKVLHFSFVRWGEIPFIPEVGDDFIQK